jgi:hypothetical protein
MLSVVILNVTYKPSILSVVMLNVVMASVFMLCVVAPTNPTCTSDQSCSASLKEAKAKLIICPFHVYCVI